MKNAAAPGSETISPCRACERRSRTTGPRSRLELLPGHPRRPPSRHNRGSQGRRTDIDAPLDVSGTPPPPDARLQAPLRARRRPHGRRGWRLVRSSWSAKNDAAIALALALDRLQKQARSGARGRLALRMELLGGAVLVAEYMNRPAETARGATVHLGAAH